VEVTATHLAILSNALLGISDTNQPWNYVSTTATSDVELAVQQNTLMRYLAGAQDHPLSCCFLQPPYHDRKQRTHTPRGPCGRPGLRPRHREGHVAAPDSGQDYITAVIPGHSRCSCVQWNLWHGTGNSWPSDLSELRRLCLLCMQRFLAHSVSQSSGNGTNCTGPCVT
jgi:hypothetical protein